MLAQRIGILLLLIGAWIPIRFSFSGGSRSPVAVVDWSASVREDPGKRQWMQRQVRRLRRRAPRLPVFAFSDTLVPWAQREVLKTRPGTRWPLPGLDPQRPVIWLTDGWVSPPRRMPQTPVLRVILPETLQATPLLSWVSPPRPGVPRLRIRLHQPVESLKVVLDQQPLVRWLTPHPGTLDVILPSLDPGPHRLTVVAPAETLSARWEEPAQAWTAGVFFRVPQDGVGVLRHLLRQTGWTVRTVWVRSTDTLELTPHGLRPLHELPQVDVAWIWDRGLTLQAPLRIWMHPAEGVRPKVQLQDSLQGVPVLGTYGPKDSLWVWMWQPLGPLSRNHPEVARRIFREVSGYLRARVPRIRWIPLDTARTDTGPVTYLLTVQPALPLQVQRPEDLSCAVLGEGVYRCRLILRKDSLVLPVHLRLGTLKRTFLFRAHRERERGTPRWDIITLRQWVDATRGRLIPEARLEEALAPVPVRREMALDHPLLGLVALLCWLVGVWVWEQRV